MSSWIFVTHGSMPEADYYLNLDTNEFKMVETTKTGVYAHVRTKGIKVGQDIWEEVATLGVSISTLATPEEGDK